MTDLRHMDRSSGAAMIPSRSRGEFDLTIIANVENWDEHDKVEENVWANLGFDHVLCGACA
jgi:hypothetical protein